MKLHQPESEMQLSNTAETARIGTSVKNKPRDNQAPCMQSACSQRAPGTADAAEKHRQHQSANDDDDSRRRATASPDATTPTISATKLSKGSATKALPPLPPAKHTPTAAIYTQLCHTTWWPCQMLALTADHCPAASRRACHAQAATTAALSTHPTARCLSREQRAEDGDPAISRCATTRTLLEAEPPATSETHATRTAPTLHHVGVPLRRCSLHTTRAAGTDRLLPQHATRADAGRAAPCH